ncbi:MAG: [protein-PII] uridylyltransferase [Methylacidiphilales bacterium]|nr:[protein-PII] uridylyltransferase [Candidatus Methylacidiphilales bacterium]
MGGHLDKVLKHAERKLLNLAERNPTDLLDLYRNFFRIEEHRIQLAHKAGDSGLESAQKRSNLFSVVLRHIFNAALENAEKSHSVKRGEVRLDMVATGGFGRGQLAPYSDIDVLFLYECAGSDGIQKRFIEDTIQQVLYLLWDIGMKVGHASRTIDEAIQQGREDLQTRTAYLEATLLAGPEDLFAEFLRRFDRVCVKGREQEYALWRLEDQAKRHEKYGNTVFLQEPNVKNGCGSLRDYQNLIWLSKALRGIDSTVGLQAEGLLTPSERKDIDLGYDFLLRIRNALHYLQQRGGDTLTLRLQGEVADSLKYPQKTILRRTEALMRDYYHHSRDIYLVADSLARRLAGRQEKKPSLFWGMLPKRMKREEVINGFVLSHGELRAASGNVFSEDPLRMVQVFQIMQQRRARLSSDLESTIRRKLGVVNRRFLWLPEVREMLTSIVRRKGEVGRILRAMHECGVLGKLIPEFGPLDCLVQHEFYHRYTADEHTLRCIEQLDMVLQEEREPYVKYRQLLLECEHPGILYLALILHDTGKAANSRDHHQVSAQYAVRFAKRMKMEGRRLQLISFLVDHHMTLTEFALRRNLDDPQTIRSFARLVQDAQRLDMLMLVTFADVQGLGDSTWSGWKEGLVWQLYRRTRDMLQGEDEFLRKAERQRKLLRGQVLKQLQGEVDAGECEAHFSSLPESYLNEAEEQRVVEDLKLVHEFFLQQLREDNDPLRPVISWRDRVAEAHSETTIVTWDRDRLFSTIAGAFSMAGLNILSADIWTREDHIVIDRFRVCTEQHEAVSHDYDRRMFRDALSSALSDSDYDIGREIVRTRGSGRNYLFDEEIVRIAAWMDNESSDQYTLLHLVAPDRIGLLYMVSKALADNHVSIANARITTEKGAALDAFYLTDVVGRKLIDVEQQRNVLRAVKRALWTEE